MRSIENQEPKVDVSEDITATPKSKRASPYRFALELQRRRVSRATLSYALIMWMNVQIGDIVFPLIGLPDWTLRLVVMIGIMGLPLIIFLTWTFQITPRGIIVDDGSGESMDRGPERKVEMAMSAGLLVLGLALATLLVAQFTFAESDDLQPVQPELVETSAERHRLITAISFRAANDRPISYAFVNGVEAEIRHQLIEMANVTVMAEADSLPVPAEGASRMLLSGSLYLDEEHVHVLAHLLDLNNNEFLWTMVVDLSGESTLEAEKIVAERIAARFQLLLDGAESTDQLVMKATAGPSRPATGTKES